MEILKTSETRVLAIMFLGMTALTFLLSSGCSESDATEQATRPDIISIDAMSAFGSLERQQVQFPHDLHTDALKQKGKDCATCHLTRESGVLSQKFMRLTDMNATDVMDIYHENCLACHKEISETNETSGPVTCGECHRREPLYQSSRQPFGFDKSLHYRHLEANDNNCRICHAEEIKGEEQSCRACHNNETHFSLKHISHVSCISCHLSKDKSGPLDCAGCHEVEHQRAIRQVENPPRLDRHQPDFALLSVPDDEVQAGRMKTVPFDHAAHEKYNNTCRVCHHQTLKKCNDCHNHRGSDSTTGIKLEQAMHSNNYTYSCVGCHNREKVSTECAGCHNFIEQGQLPENTCATCHTGPSPDRLASVRSRYRSLDDFRPRRSETRLSFDENDVPQTVTIGMLSEKYEPVIMPHRRHVNRLMQDIQGSRIATYFHGHEDVVCQGCHHHSPAGVKPPLCESCHQAPFDENNMSKPGLYGAYHRNCLGCHQNMNIKEPSDCVGCHAEKKALPDL